MKRNILNNYFITFVLIMLFVIISGCQKKQMDSASKSELNLGQKTFTIAYVGYSSTNPFWNALAASARKSSKNLSINFLDLTASAADMAQQKTAVDNAIIRGVDGLLIGAVDSRGLGDSFDKAQAAGIQIVTVDTRVDHPAVRSHIATDNIAAANLAGEYIAERLNNKGKVLILGGSTGSQTADDRQKGVEEILHRHTDMETIFRVANWDAKQANEITNNVLSSNPDLRAIFAACDPMIFTAMQAVKAKGKLDDVVLVGFDAIPAVLKAIKAGDVDATVRQDPERMGKEGMELLVRHLQGEKIPTHVQISAEIIDKTNVIPFLTK